VSELCHLIRGRVRLEDDSARSWTFEAGDSFVIPAGFVGVWEVQESVKKLYVIVESRSK
jgi:hypothetical protein